MRLMTSDEMEKSDIFLREIVCLKQHWNPSTVYQYLSSPRRKSGFVLFTTPGAVYTEPDGTVLTPQAGDLVYLPARSCYRASFSQKEGESYLVVFRMLDADGEEINLYDRLILLPGRHHPGLLSQIRELAREYRSALDNSLYLTALTFAFLHTVLSDLKADRSPIQNALEEINHSLSADHSIQELARACFMSECTFRRKFKELTGFSPTQYIREQKIKKAAQMLKESDCSPDSIVSALNFYDNAHFCRAFKARMGMTPIQYRMANTT